jgi:hypothetical protein
VVEELFYKPKGRWFEIRRGEGILSVYLIVNFSILGFTQPLTEMCIRGGQIIFLESKAAAGA